MKFKLLFIFLLGFNLSSFSQILIGRSYEYIVQSLDKLGITQKDGLTKPQNERYLCGFTKAVTIAFYFNDKNLCKYQSMLFAEGLPYEAIQEICLKNFLRVDGMNVYDSENKYKGRIELIPGKKQYVIDIVPI